MSRVVVVIGGGAAGLQCSRSLLRDHGFHESEVLLIEARPVVGGRVAPAMLVFILVLVCVCVCVFAFRDCFSAAVRVWGI